MLMPILFQWNVMFEDQAEKPEKVAARRELPSFNTSRRHEQMEGLGNLDRQCK